MAGMWGSGDQGAAETRARRAGSFGTQAAIYAEHRPDYPQAGIRWALEPVAAGDNPVVLDLGAARDDPVVLEPVAAGAEPVALDSDPADNELAVPRPDAVDYELVVLDLGAGTGKLSGGLLEAGVRVIAVEPDDAMRGEFERRYPGVTALSGAAEAIPLADGAVDAVVAGQAFHWFDQALAFPEIARVLRPGGVFAAFWNNDDHRVDWVAGLHRVSRTSASFPSATGGDTLPAHPLFEPFESAEFDHTQRRSAASLTTAIGTHSHTVVISERERAEVLARILDYLRARPETATGEFDFPLRTGVIRAIRRPDTPA
ncbi:class I SAM-dependent methyltransferase [Nocardia lasii]|uniref:Class I SAM-dependent methyltransferase n=1 Tax=Nocardia lasii TaxID=1616107 RepID=A0ABW1JPR7_9NOCA